MTEELRNKINTSLKESMKTQDKCRVSTLRLINAAIKDRDIAGRDGGDNKVSDPEIIEILAKMVKQRKESIKAYEDAGRVELAEIEQDEIDIIAEFLPKQLTEAEIQTVCEEAIKEVGADGLKDMGKTMGLLKEKYSGTMDFAKAGAIIKSILSN